MAVVILAGSGWRGHVFRRSTAFTRWDMLLAACGGVAVMIASIGATALRGDVSALLAVGLVAAVPVPAAVALRFWWWLPRVAAARARKDSSADGDADPGRV